MKTSNKILIGYVAASFAAVLITLALLLIG